MYSAAARASRLFFVSAYCFSAVFRRSTASVVWERCYLAGLMNPHPQLGVNRTCAAVSSGWLGPRGGLVAHCLYYAWLPMQRRGSDYISYYFPFCRKGETTLRTSARTCTVGSCAPADPTGAPEQEDERGLSALVCTWSALITRP